MELVAWGRMSLESCRIGRVAAASPRGLWYGLLTFSDVVNLGRILVFGMKLR